MSLYITLLLNCRYYLVCLLNRLFYMPLTFLQHIVFLINVKFRNIHNIRYNYVIFSVRAPSTGDGPEEWVPSLQAVLNLNLVSSLVY